MAKPHFTADCPRCGANKITFDVIAYNEAGFGETQWQKRFELPSVCRSCDLTTIWRFQLKTYNLAAQSSTAKFWTENYNVHHDFSQIGFISVKDAFGVETPEYVPENIGTIFREAATCLSVGAYDASGAMSRKVLDVSTRSLIGVEPQTGDKMDANYISWKQAKDLRLRLDWLFERKRLPESLKDLASCVHQDGNDAAHSSETIGRDGAIDLQDFTIAILETLYTMPGKINANITRRNARNENK